ncbi:acyltransferase family protein [Cylindrospermopsis raciborskii UAM/DH-BiRr]|uniref:acyltransferase family protein n=1 Tax=Cylindrospermopsis raciborskii TaxID=77022 RepID=UPI00387A7BB6
MRLISLDVFRGLTIAMMIIANMAGVVPDVYPFLSHAPWNGCTPTDLVFPFFLFIVGVAMSFSLSKYSLESKLDNLVYFNLCRRAVILFTLGLLINGFWNQGVGSFDLQSLRVMGVLQRIGLAYLFASLIVLKLPEKTQWALAGILLIFYWLTMMYIPVPDYGAGMLTQEGNFGAFIDRLIIAKPHLYAGDGFNFRGDPEGLFSTIPAIVNVLFGYFAGQWIRKSTINSHTSMDLVLWGLCSLVVGMIWDGLFPINKKLWTSSYVLFSTGWGLVFLAACYDLIEVRKIKRWSKGFEIIGLNAIALFVASVFLIKVTVKLKIGEGDNAISVYNWIYRNLFASWVGNTNGSFLFALATLSLWYGLAFFMYRQRWFIKV